MPGHTKIRMKSPVRVQSRATRGYLVRVNQ